MRYNFHIEFFCTLDIYFVPFGFTLGKRTERLVFDLLFIIYCNTYFWLNFVIYCIIYSKYSICFLSLFSICVGITRRHFSFLYAEQGICVCTFGFSIFLYFCVFLIQYLCVGVFSIVICDTDLGILGRNLILFCVFAYF